MTKTQSYGNNLLVTARQHAQTTSALIAFRARNARSFRDEIEFSMQATAMAESRYVREVPWREGGAPLRVLPAAGVFGANASGKSNLLEVMHDMSALVLGSFQFGRPGGPIPRRHFLLDERYAAEPTRYEIDLVLDGVLHNYGFEVSSDRVVEEWAYRFPHGRSALLFHRLEADVRLGAAARPKGRAAAGILRPNALYLSTAAYADHPALLPLFEWFGQNLLLADVDTRPFRQALTTHMIEDEKYRTAILELLHAADLGISDAQRIEPDPVQRERIRMAVRILRGDEEPGEAGDHIDTAEVMAGISLTHPGAGGDVEMDSDDESIGTLVWFGLIGPVLNVLESGSVLLADELGASLHPVLVRELLRMFQDRNRNPRCAQIIFNSHDPGLLGEGTGDRLLGRDQIWFTEKMSDGATRLRPLTDAAPRRTEAISKRYLEGWYGATPILIPGGFDSAAELVATDVD